MWLLTLVFTCCGFPLSASLPQDFPTLEACNKAGQVWLQPNSNPQGAVRTFRCSPLHGKRETPAPSRER